MGPPKTCQVIARLLSAGMAMDDGMEGSANERQSAQRQSMFQVGIWVMRLSLMSWSLAAWENLMRSTGGCRGRRVKREG